MFFVPGSVVRLFSLRWSWMVLFRQLHTDVTGFQKRKKVSCSVSLMLNLLCEEVSLISFLRLLESVVVFIYITLSYVFNSQFIGHFTCCSK